TALVNVCILRLPRQYTATLFPYTTLFRSSRGINNAQSACPAPIGRPGDLGAGRGRRRKQRGRPGFQRLYGSDRNIVLAAIRRREDRKSTRLNSSHVKISYAVICLKKENNH